MKAIIKSLRISSLIFIVYFSAAIDLLLIPGYENQIDAAVNVLRPIISAAVPILNIGYTVFAFFVLVAVLILTAFKHFNISNKEAVSDISKLNPHKEG
jgi:hypothetical protein